MTIETAKTVEQSQEQAQSIIESIVTSASKKTKKTDKKEAAKKEATKDEKKPDVIIRISKKLKIAFSVIKKEIESSSMLYLAPILMRITYLANDDKVKVKSCLCAKLLTVDNVTCVYNYHLNDFQSLVRDKDTYLFDVNLMTDIYVSDDYFKNLKQVQKVEVKSLKCFSKSDRAELETLFNYKKVKDNK